MLLVARTLLVAPEATSNDDTSQLLMFAKSSYFTDRVVHPPAARGVPSGLPRVRTRDNGGSTVEDLVVESDTSHWSVSPNREPILLLLH